MRPYSSILKEFMNKNLKFTIIVPTLNRHDTLLHCLKTLNVLEGSDFEVLVSNNCSTHETDEVIEQFKNNINFRVIRPEEKLTMAAHYEFAVSHARGEYITILGDDDGFIHDGLNVARDILLQNKPDILFWFPHMYWWTNALIPSKQGMLYLSLVQRKAQYVSPFSYIENFYKDQKNYWLFERLPSIYNGFVHRNVIEKVIRRTGRYFSELCPDVYSGIANGICASNAIYVEYPLTIRGLSKNSVGVAYRKRSEGDKILELQLQPKKITMPPQLVDSSALAVHVAGVKLNAMNNFEELRGFDINIPSVIDGILSEIEEDNIRAGELIQDARLLAEKYDLLISDNSIGELMSKVSEKIVQKDWGIRDGLLAINAELLDVNDIYKASLLVKSILG